MTTKGSTIASASPTKRGRDEGTQQDDVCKVGRWLSTPEAQFEVSPVPIDAARSGAKGRTRESCPASAPVVVGQLNRFPSGGRDVCVAAGVDLTGDAALAEVIDRLSLTSAGRAALARSEYVDPSAYTMDQLSELFHRRCFLMPPPKDTGSILVDLAPKAFHEFALYTQSTRQKAVAEALRFGDEFTTTAMLCVSAELAAEALSQGTAMHADRPTSMGMINFQQALGYVAMMTAPNGRAYRQLLNRAVGGAAPELPLKVAQDPRYVSIFYTFDRHAEVNCEGTPLANATKARMLGASLPGTLSIKSCQGDPNSYVDEINALCKEGTGGKIPEIVTELDPDCVAVLLCCVFLKVEWEMPGERLGIAEFHPHPASMATTAAAASAAPLLTRQRYFGYTKTRLGSWTDPENGVTWIQLDCTPDEHTGDARLMLYALPASEDDDYTASLFASMKRLSMDKFVTITFDKVQLPCVSVATNALDGKAMLQKLGVSDIFCELDSLPMMFWSPASDGGVVVSRVIHASCIEWNDKGAEAAAATLVEFA